MKKAQTAARSSFQKALLPMAILGLSLATPATAQAQGRGAQLEEIIVSARRQTESAQEIPISITVFNQEQLSNNNVFSSVDLAQYTPSLSVNTRFGPDQASFAIRGFTQELRTTASVGFYFAEVVAPRGGVGAVTAGDGAGPGYFFDLQDVLVLKGPQGTLFGRNTTGGAILLTPQEPTTNLEGYLEGSVGNYDMHRVQGVINIPMGDNVRARFGIDTMERDGYIDNVSGVGPSKLGDTDYISARASVIWDISDSLSNYTIATYTDSENNGVASSLFACGAGLYGDPRCSQQLARQGSDFYGISSLTEDPVSKLEQWQVINTTTWAATDDITVKNIVSFSDMEQTSISAIYGIDYDYYALFGLSNPSPFDFTQSGAVPGGLPTNSQTSFVEEIQVQGYAFDSRLTWQAGLYFENSKPNGDAGSQAVNQLYCSSFDTVNPANSECVDIQRNMLALSGLTAPVPGLGDVPVAALRGPLGSVSRLVGTMEYTTKAAYTEMTYDITDQWKVTGGLRYTHDKSEGKIKDGRAWAGYAYQGITPSLPTPGNAAVFPASADRVERCIYGDPDPAVNGCTDKVDQTSEAVTGLLNVDYFPADNVMLYAKYSRGYRMGSVNLYGGDPFRVFDPETVDAYELGAKTRFDGVIPGTFNIALFYNELKDQQLTVSYLPAGSTPTTGVVNAGKSVIQGLEIESSLMLLDDLALNLSYTYLDTELKEFAEPAPPPRVDLGLTSVQGEDLTYSPRHALVANLNYRLPLAAEIGEVSVGATYSYTDKQLATAPEFISSYSGRLAGTPNAWLPSYEVVNFNINWLSIMGTNFDASLFMTNAFDEKYTTYVSGLYNSTGFETRMVGQPRMWGARLRYTFGQ